MFKIVTIGLHIVILFSIYRIGVWIQELFHLFIPGSVIGMILLFVLLITGIINVQWIEKGSHLMIRFLPFFFIPVTVGMIDYLNLFAGKGILLVIITLISTVLVMGCSGFISELLMRKKERSHE